MKIEDGPIELINLNLETPMINGPTSLGPEIILSGPCKF